MQNYRIGAVLTEMYTHAEHLQKTTEVKTRGYGDNAYVLREIGGPLNPINGLDGKLSSLLHRRSRG